MARYGVSTALVALTVLMSPAAAQSGVPPLSEFEADCRQGNIIAPSCERIIFGFYAEVHGTTPDKVRCDGVALWQERDAQPAYFATMAWPDAIGLLVMVPGVCSLDVAISAPTCAEGSPDPVVVKSFTATPDDTYQEGALRLDYVLTNTLDRDLDYIRGSLTWLDTAGEIRFAHSLQEGQLIHAGADFQSSMMLLNGTQVLQDASALTVLACTVLVVDTNEVEQAF